MSIHPFRLAIPLILLAASFQSALASITELGSGTHRFPGASVPWVTYQGKDMAATGTKLGPGYAPFTVEAESSERQCVKLSATGQYVEFKARESANSLVVRYSIPDSSDGVGIDSTLSLYKNGVLGDQRHHQHNSWRPGVARCDNSRRRDVVHNVCWRSDPLYKSAPTGSFFGRW
jgi:hypothetical protein